MGFLCYDLPMILSDRDIKKAIESGRVKIESSQPELFQHIHASSMDLRLGNVFKLYEHSKFAILDPKNPETFAGNMRTSPLRMVTLLLCSRGSLFWA